MNRTFKTLGIQQVANGNTDESRLHSLWIDTPGLEITDNFASKLIPPMSSDEFPICGDGGLIGLLQAAPEVIAAYECQTGFPAA